MRRKYLPTLYREPEENDDDLLEAEWEQHEMMTPPEGRHRPLMRYPDGGLMPARRPVGRPRMYPARYEPPPEYYDNRAPLGPQDVRVQAGRLRPGERISMRQYSGVEVSHHRNAGDQLIKAVIVLIIGVLLFKGCAQEAIQTSHQVNFGATRHATQ